MCGAGGGEGVSTIRVGTAHTQSGKICYSYGQHTAPDPKENLGIYSPTCVCVEGVGWRSESEEDRA